MGGHVGHTPSKDEIITELLEALEVLLGGKCPECKGWGEVAYCGEVVSCRCAGKFRHTPTEEQIAKAHAAIAKAKGEA